MYSHIRLQQSLGNDITCANNVDMYYWNREICWNREGTSRGEEVDIRSPNITEARSSQLFRNKKVLFVGDSHMRGLAELLIDQVCRYKVAANKVMFSNQGSSLQAVEFKKADFAEYRAKMESKCTLQRQEADCQRLFAEGCFGLTVAYNGQMLCEPDMLDVAANYDFVVFNCGHHPASKHHYSISTYRNAVRTLLRSEKVHAATTNSRTKFFWLENVAQVSVVSISILLKFV